MGRRGNISSIDRTVQSGLKYSALSPLYQNGSYQTNIYETKLKKWMEIKQKVIVLINLKSINKSLLGY